MEKKAANPLDHLKEQVTCPICQKLYKAPKVLPCQHNFCKDCLGDTTHELQQGNYFLKCPTCQEPALLPEGGVSALPPAFNINKLLDLHQLMLDKGERVKCPEHNKPLKIYCNTCSKTICHVCIYRAHNDHDHSPVDDVFEQCKSKIEERMKQVAQSQISISDACNAIVTRKKEIKEQAEAVKKQIHQKKEQIQAMLEEVANQLLDEVNEAMEGKLRVLTCQEQDSKASLACLQHLDELVKQSMRSRSHQQIIESMEPLMKQAEDTCTLAKMADHKPIEDANFMFKESEVSKLHIELELGEIQYSNLSQQCYITQHNQKKATCGETTSFQVHVPALRDIDDRYLLLRTGVLSCELRARDATLVQRHISRTGPDTDTYTFKYTPVTSGLHRLSVTVGGRHITGSPSSIPVFSIPIARKGIPVHTITGLNRPHGVAVGASGMIIVSEQQGHCLVVLNSQGKKIQSFGSQGDGPGELNFPCGIALTADQRILVADKDNHRISLFSMDGDFITSLGGMGTELGQLLHPEAVTVDSSGHIMVADTGNHRISVFNPDHSFSHIFGQRGSNLGEFDSPCDLTTDSQGKVYVNDYNNHCVQVFSPLGKSYVSQFSRIGHQGSLSSPSGIAIDSSDNVYISEHFNNRVSVLSSSGKLLSSFGNRGCGDGEFMIPCGLAVDAGGELYVCDRNNARLVLL